MVHASPFVVFALLVLFLSHAPSAYSNVNANELCAKHRNPSFCVAILNSRPGADVHALATFIIDLAHASASTTHNLIKSLVESANDPALKKYYKSCSEHYSDALSSIEEAKKNYHSKDYFGMNIAASALMTNVDDCDKTSPEDPSPLPKNTKELEDISIIIMIVANHLKN